MKKISRFNSYERYFLAAIFVSTCGDVLIPTAFALESLRVDRQGSGFTAVLLVLWCGRFFGTLLYRKVSNLQLMPMMIGADVVRLLAQAILSIWIVVFGNSILAMSISSLIYGLATAFFMPSRFAVTPDIVSSEKIQKFNSTVSLMTDSLMIISPAAATVIFIYLGFVPLLVFDAVTFLIAIILLVSLRLKQNIVSLLEEAEVGPERTLGDFKLFPQWSLIGLAAWAAITLLIGYSGTAGPAFIIERFGPGEWALVSTALAAGSVLGSAGHLIGLFNRLSWRTLQVIAGFLISAQVFLFAASNSLFNIILFAFLASLIMTSAGIAWDTEVQKSLNREQLRIFANWDAFLTTGTVPVGMVLFGLSTLLGVPVVFTLGVAVLCAVSLLPLLLTRNSL